MSIRNRGGSAAGQDETLDFELLLELGLLRKSGRAKEEWVEQTLAQVVRVGATPVQAVKAAGQARGAGNGVVNLEQAGAGEKRILEDLMALGSGGSSKLRKQGGQEQGVGNMAEIADAKDAGVAPEFRWGAAAVAKGLSVLALLLGDVDESSRLLREGRTLGTWRGSGTAKVREVVLDGAKEGVEQRCRGSAREARPGLEELGIGTGCRACHGNAEKVEEGHAIGVVVGSHRGGEAVISLGRRKLLVEKDRGIARRNPHAVAGANFFRVGRSGCVGIHQSVVWVGSDPLVGGLVGEDAGGRGELGQVVGEWNDVELAMGGDVVEQGEGLVVPRGRRQAGTGRERNRPMQKLDHTRTGAAQDGESHGVAALSRRQRALDKNIRGVR